MPPANRAQQLAQQVITARDTIIHYRELIKEHQAVIDDSLAELAKSAGADYYKNNQGHLNLAMPGSSLFILNWKEKAGGAAPSQDRLQYSFSVGKVTDGTELEIDQQKGQE